MPTTDKHDPLGLESPKYADKLDNMFSKRDYLRKSERVALQYWREPDWDHLKPLLVCCDGNKDLLAVWNYYRFLISSEPQGGFPAGRSSFWMVLDHSTNAFLGLFGYTSFAQSWPYLESYLGWDNTLRLEHRKHIQFLARCLPAEPFGDLLGGKLLASVAVSQDILHWLELRYSLPVAAVGICTLHGQGSQYNRLEKEGINFLGEDDKGRGCYFAPARHRAEIFLGNHEEPLGDWCIPTLEARIAHWKERWYNKRYKHRGAPTFDSKQYMLGRFL